MWPWLPSPLAKLAGSPPDPKFPELHNFSFKLWDAPSSQSIRRSTH